MRASLSIIEYIKKQEDLRLKPYELFGKWHVGYGHLLSSPLEMGTITEAKADALLGQDIEKSENAVNRFVKVKLNQDQFDALVDFTYNRGSGTLQDSTLLKRINAGGSKKEIEAAFLMHNKAGGQVNEGLTKRRQYEADLFNGNPVQRFYTKNKRAVQVGATLIIIVIVIILIWRWNKNRK